MSNKRKIIKIDEDKCNGCAECIPNCPEGALQVIDGKARLISDLFCDGLGACIGHCPKGAITIEEREAEPYDERKVMSNIIKQGKNVIIAHLKHLKEHKQNEYFKQAIDFLAEKGAAVPAEKIFEIMSAGGAKGAIPSGCPGAKTVDFREDKETSCEDKGKRQSQLRQWPVQITLVSPQAPYLNNADLLIAADCVPFAYADFHKDFLKGKTLLVGCPKLDDLASYKEKITQILKLNNIKSITYVHMEVPCCFGLVEIIRSAISALGKKVPFKEVVISIKGEKKETP